MNSRHHSPRKVSPTCGALRDHVQVLSSLIHPHPNLAVCDSHIVSTTSVNAQMLDRPWAS